MNNPIPAFVFGGVLLLIGALMLRSQRHARNVAEESSSETERMFLLRRIRRRIQVAGMILLIGMMILIGDSISWKEAPGTFAVYWMIVLGLAVWIGLLAMGDMAATRAYMARELNQLHRSQLELHRVAQRVRQESRNTHSDS